MNQRPLGVDVNVGMCILTLMLVYHTSIRPGQARPGQIKADEIFNFFWSYSGRENNNLDVYR
jgi:hypothetical protein